MCKCYRLPFLMLDGRSWSEKLLYASASQIFAEARKWVVKHG